MYPFQLHHITCFPDNFMEDCYCSTKILNIISTHTRVLKINDETLELRAKFSAKFGGVFQAHMRQCYCGNIYQLKLVNYFRKKAPS